MMLITDECRSLTKFDELMLSRAKKLKQDLKKWQNILLLMLTSSIDITLYLCGAKHID